MCCVCSIRIKKKKLIINTNQKEVLKFEVFVYVFLCLLLQQLGQLALVLHLCHNIAPTNKLPIHIKLRNSRPVAKGLDALPDLAVL